MWETTDPDGRRVTLSVTAWRHIVEEHAELATLRDLVLAAVRAPSRRIPGRSHGEEWFYLATPRDPPAG